MLREYLTNIANAIRAKLGTTDTINAQDFSTKVDEVYEAGKKAEYDEFWDKYLSARLGGQYMFCGGAWNPNTFRPSKDIVPVTYANNMFYFFNYQGTGAVLDLEEHLQSLGVKLDTSKVIVTQYMFREAYISRVGILDFTSVTDKGLNYTFFNSKLTTIDKLIVTAATKYSSPFYGASSLVNLTMEGTIGQSGFSVSPCTKLTKASITSIINALSQTTSGIAVTLSKTAVNKAFETSEGAKDGSTSQEWANLIATKTNWTINLS